MYQSVLLDEYCKVKEIIMNSNSYNNLANKLIEIEDKIIEMETIIKMLNIWIKDNNYELIPIIKILNEKFNAITKTLRK